MSSSIQAPGGLPLRSAMKPDDDSERDPTLTTTTKAVQIAEPEPESPEECQPIKQFSAGVGRRLSGRPPVLATNSSRSSTITQSGLEALNSLAGSQTSHQGPSESEGSHGHHRPRLDHLSSKLIAQVAEWLEHERSKSHSRKARRARSGRRKSPPVEDGSALLPTTSADPPSPEVHAKHHRKYSLDSQSSEVSLDRLQRIIDDSMSALGLNSIPHFSPRLHAKKHSKRRSLLHLNRTVSSDTEFYDGDVLVPKCDAWLDNSKTMSYCGGAAAGGVDDAVSISSKKEEKERKAWIKFKNEIIRITHTLRIKGWRRVPLDCGDRIGVERLSGALTNAVYVVSPPDDLEAPSEPGRKPPAKLLLRIYGPQVENIIDRESELCVLRRLARKKIGPRMLGTFENGRFEQFFNAITLTPAHLREPETSKQIAKRMRELHDGIELLEEEKDIGPSVFKNWDFWLENVSRVATFLDSKALSGIVGPIRGPSDVWKKRGYVCGLEWAKFKDTVDKYRRWVDAYYGSPQNLRDHLVFAHNDTQYGNILRVRPDDHKSPLLHPQNEHKQLVVIDFEYAGANTRGLEFANHFTEWAYNYHDATASYACNIPEYPSPEEQRRFIKEYVNHRPQFPHAGSTPNLGPIDTPVETPGTPGLSGQTPGTSSSIVEFMLDARAPSCGWTEDERRREEHIEKEIKTLMEEARVWRIANSAQWVAWGIMQATVPGLDKNEPSQEQETEGAKPAPIASPEKEAEEAEEFDYLGYAHDRVLFFWGDCVSMGIIKPEELPEDLRERIKIIDY